jgi:Tfp pilus assembly protein PilE
MQQGQAMDQNRNYPCKRGNREGVGRPHPSPLPKGEGVHRRGMTLFELAVALFILTTAMLAIVQLMAATATQRRLVDQRRVALQEVANQAERVALLTWGEVAPETLTTWEPSADLAKSLPQAKCEAKVTAETNEPRARRIRLSVTWTSAAGQAVEPATVTMWRFAGEKQR